jgi:hypothetical protein
MCTSSSETGSWSPSAEGYVIVHAGAEHHEVSAGLAADVLRTLITNVNVPPLDVLHSLLLGMAETGATRHMKNPVILPQRPQAAST